ncbi:MAG TPA: GNAT family N-acetyltransferase [bacterium]|nr:GNAT family N-acetyltransferase [bacterium]
MQQRTALKLEYVSPEDRKFRDWLRKYREEITGEPPADEWLDAYIRHIFAEQGRSRHIWWALDGQRPVGFAVAIITAQSAGGSRVQGTVAEFFIYPEYRREGFGRRMAEAVLEFMQGKGAHDIHASVTTGNVRGLRFWEACSFQISRYVLVHRPGLKREEDEDEDEL